VILPTFNRSDYLRSAVESVFAQTFDDWELVIADDGSTEETRAYLRGLPAPRVRTLWLSHSGNPARARNAGIAVAAGRYLAFLDSDDVWAPTKLEKQTKAMAAHAGRGWSYTGCDRIDEDGRPLDRVPTSKRPTPDGWILEPLLTLELSIAMPTVVAERTLVTRIRGFDERQRFGEFHDFCVRLAMRSEVVSLGEALCSVRSHRQHYSGDRIAARESWDDLYRKMAALAPNDRVRSRCRRLRADASLDLASLRERNGDYRGVWRTLAKASAFSWRYPGWWLGALKRIARPVVPVAVIKAYKRRRSASAI